MRSPTVTPARAPGGPGDLFRRAAGTNGSCCCDEEGEVASTSTERERSGFDPKNTSESPKALYFYMSGFLNPLY